MQDNDPWKQPERERFFAREARKLTAPAHDGRTYEPDQDEKRLTSLRERIRVYMMRKPGGWCTLDELVQHCGGTAASVSSKIRDLRKHKHGGWPIEAQRVRAGLWKYRIGAKP